MVFALAQTRKAFATKRTFRKIVRAPTDLMKIQVLTYPHRAPMIEAAGLILAPFVDAARDPTDLGKSLIFGSPG